MQSHFSSFRLLKSLLVSLFKFKPALAIYTFSLITLKSLSAGITFLMILPLLEWVGLSDPGKTTYISGWVSSLFNIFNLKPTLVIMLCFFTIIMCCTAYLTYLEQQSSTLLQQRYNQHLRTQLQRSLLGSHWSFLQGKKKSDLIYMLTSETQNLALCNHQLLLLINQIFLIGVNTSIAFYLSWRVTSFAVGAAMFLFMIMLPLHQKIIRAGTAHLKANQHLHQVISQQLYSLKAIKGSGLEASSMEMFAKTGSTLESLGIQFNKMIAVNRLRNTVGSAIFLSGLLYLAIQIFAVPIHLLMTLLIIYARFLPLVTSAQQIYQRILHQLPAYQHIVQLLSDTQQHQEIFSSDVVSFEQEINVCNISFKYPQAERWIIDQKSFQLKKNTSTLILGSSGVGKTTLVDLISGLLTPAQGQIWVDDILINSSNAQAWRTQIAYITQDIFLLNATIRENLLDFNPECSSEDLLQALELAAADFVHRLPDGLDTLIGDSGITLSGGERQRIALARAIIQKPQLLILDESTSSLDSERVSYIQQSLATLKGRLTILMISHQKMDLRMIDQVIHLTHSKLDFA